MVPRCLQLANNSKDKTIREHATTTHQLLPHGFSTRTPHCQNSLSVADSEIQGKATQPSSRVKGLRSEANSVRINTIIDVEEATRGII